MSETPRVRTGFWVAESIVVLNIIVPVILQFFSKHTINETEKRTKWFIPPQDIWQGIMTHQLENRNPNKGKTQTCTPRIVQAESHLVKNPSLLVFYLDLCHYSQGQWPFSL